MAVVAGCSSTGVTVDRRPKTDTPWVVPAADLGTRRLLRVRLETPERKGRFRLLLLLQSSERYQIRATHPVFNRRLWALDVQGEEALLVDYLQKRACVYEGRAEIEAVPLGPFPFAGIPALLLGYLPLAPAGEATRTAAEVAYSDDEGRRWRALLESGRVASWSAFRDGEELAAWRLDPEGTTMEAVERGIRLRWRETLREPGPVVFRDLEAPGDVEAGGCDLGWLSGVEDAPWEED